MLCIMHSYIAYFKLQILFLQCIQETLIESLIVPACVRVFQMSHYYRVMPPAAEDSPSLPAVEYSTISNIVNFIKIVIFHRLQ